MYMRYLVVVQEKSYIFKEARSQFRLHRAEGDPSKVQLLVRRPCSLPTCFGGAALFCGYRDAVNF